eukprot:TRINITY_DN5260_c0_g1_i2.p1 TRINITY_DN5260_c0_g1~~TRINITY_DN5260_c0_g1_i2.p1  ORF type:complete len:252 (-),score=66.04 TRINITY_DN5260_c0_g1_i2:177-932(-)
MKSTYSYGEASYWNSRYESEGPEVTFDWYQKYSSLSPFFDLFITKAEKVLMVGCGNAALSFDMVQAGYEEIWNIDISQVLIDTMKAKHTDIQQLKYFTMDVRSLQFDDGAFGAVVDKGTLDAIMCGEDASSNVKLMLSQVARVLQPGGYFIMITYGEPQVRMPHLIRPEFGWTASLYITPRPGTLPEVNLEKFLKPVPVSEEGKILSDLQMDLKDFHFIYVCKKSQATHDGEEEKPLLTSRSPTKENNDDS